MAHPISPARQSSQSQHSQPPRCTSLYSSEMMLAMPAHQPSAMLITPTQRRWARRLLVSNHPNALFNHSLILLLVNYVHLLSHALVVLCFSLKLLSRSLTETTIVHAHAYSLSEEYSLLDRQLLILRIYYAIILYVLHIMLKLVLHRL